MSEPAFDLFAPFFQIRAGDDYNDLIRSFKWALAQLANTPEELYKLVNKPGFVMRTEIEHCSGSDYDPASSGPPRWAIYDTRTIKSLVLTCCDEATNYKSDYTRFLKEIGGPIIKALIHARNEGVLKELLQSKFYYRKRYKHEYGGYFGGSEIKNFEDPLEMTMAEALQYYAPLKNLANIFELSTVEKAYLDGLIKASKAPGERKA